MTLRQPVIVGEPGRSVTRHIGTPLRRDFSERESFRHDAHIVHGLLASVPMAD